MAACVHARNKPESHHENHNIPHLTRPYRLEIRRVIHAQIIHSSLVRLVPAHANGHKAKHAHRRDGHVHAHGDGVNGPSALEEEGGDDFVAVHEEGDGQLLFTRQHSVTHIS